MLFHQVLPIENCGALRDVVGIFFVIAETTTSLQFLHRVRAIFYGETIIITCFVVLWLAVVSTSFVVPFITDVAYMGTTKYCDLHMRTRYVPLAVVVMASIFYTLVFLATSWRLVSNMQFASDNDSRTDLCWKRVKSMFRGDNLPALSREVLRGGRKYYMCVHLTEFQVVSSH